MNMVFFPPVLSSFVGRLSLLVTLACCAAQLLHAQQEAFYDLAPVNYSSAKDHNTITRLQAAIDEQRRTLPGSSSREILKSLLDELNIPVASQTLVFSKTSKQHRLISPENPRVLYFNSNFYVGYVPGGMIEVVSCDDSTGMMFYTYDTAQPAEKRKFSRDNSCLSCHSSSNTRDIPGVLVRSVYADRDGQALLTWGTFTTTPSSPMSERWGGWYVTGKHGDSQHLGNKWVSISADGTEKFRMKDGQNVEKLSSYLKTDKYLTNTSDLVALMIMEHQIEAHNVLYAARLNYLRRVYLIKAIHDGKYDAAEPTSEKMIQSHVDSILKVLLFSDEIRLPADGVQGSEEFVTEFSKRGKSYNEWSLRDLRLQKRLFKYRCSYMIHSEAFKILPEPIKTATLRQLHAILTKGTTPEGLPVLSSREKERIHQILSHTHPDYQKVSSNS